MDITRALETLADRRDLTRPAMRELIRALMSGDATPAQIGGVLVALRMKGESVEEITGAVEVMRALATRVEVDVPHLVDTCGTGGSGHKLFNVSTAAAFVAAAAGAHVAKHGNRGMTSKSGSADLLEAAGVSLTLTPEQVARCIRDVGVGFLFAQRHHSAMKHVAAPRRELGIRTLFNVLGPLTNPAGAPNQVLGVFDGRWQHRLAEVLRDLGSRHVMIVHAEDGLDEISLAGPTRVVELRDGEIREYALTPERFGMRRQPLDALAADSPAASLALVQAALAGEGPAADMVALNAGAAIHVSGVALTLEDGVTMAQDAIATGLARERLDELVRITRLMGED
ncbi:MAG: anthranilate phosphoribosyltransferase [Pseudomonadales bacterium]|jgi:anthranilate phosphoribosyltransferase|nr:anthranilate phosphoribosyltransferase [Pseudomonadales bacterium]